MHLVHIIWKGKGWMVFLTVFLCSLVSELISEAITHDEEYYQTNPYPLSIALFVSAIFPFLLDYKLRTATINIDPKIVRKSHSLFFIPVWYWGFILLALAILNIVL